jgi:hypothetical protein
MWQLSTCATTARLSRFRNRPQEAAAQLAGYEMLLLVDARRPVAPFGYA